MRPERPLIEEVRKLADDQVARAIASLEKADEDVETAVHDARKRFKKIRALLRLVRPGLGKTYKSENAFYRDLGRDLSDIRDAQVMSKTLATLSAKAPTSAAAELLAPVCAWTQARRKHVLERQDVHLRTQTTRHHLITGRLRIEDWALDADPPAAALIGGLKKTYKRARNRFDEALAMPEPTRMHEWRKRVKYHWYHCRLLRAAWPSAIDPHIDALDSLADDLGADHDLAVLAQTLRDDQAADIPAPSVRAAHGLAMRVSSDLRERAFAAAPRLFAETPGALARRFEAYWTSATLAQAPH